MLLQEILQSVEARFPASLNSQFSLGIKGKFDRYLTLLNSFELNTDTIKATFDQQVKSAIPVITEISNEILAAFDLYFINNHRACFSKLNEIISRYNQYFRFLITTDQNTGDVPELVEIY